MTLSGMTGSTIEGEPSLTESSEMRGKVVVEGDMIIMEMEVILMKKVILMDLMRGIEVMEVMETLIRRVK